MVQFLVLDLCPLLHVVMFDVVVNSDIAMESMYTDPTAEAGEGQPR